MPELPQHLPINKQRTPCAEKNDKLGWTHGCSLHFQGFTIGIRTNREGTLERLKGLLPPALKIVETREVDVLLSFLCAKDSQRRGVQHYNLVYDGWNRIARTRDVDEALKVFSAASRAQLATFAQDSIFVVGEVVGLKGRAVILLDEKGDKSLSLADALCLQGADRYSNGLVQIDLAGCVRGFEMREDETLEPALILQPGKEGRTWRPVVLTQAEAVMAMFGRAPGAAFHPKRTLEALSKLARQSTALGGRRGTTSGVVPFVLKHLQL